MKELNLESGGDHYYLFEDAHYFYNGNDANKINIKKRVVKTKYKLPKQVFGVPLALDHRGHRNTIDEFTACIISGNEAAIIGFIEDYKKEIELDTYPQEEIDRFNILNELYYWSDISVYTQDSYVVVYTTIRELRGSEEAEVMNRIIQAYESL